MPAMVGVVAEPAPAAAPVAAEQAAIDEALLPTEEDLLYEEELLRNPYSLKMWSRYIEARQGIAAQRRDVLFERALKALPGSYKVRRALKSPSQNVTCPRVHASHKVLLQSGLPRLVMSNVPDASPACAPPHACMAVRVQLWNKYLGERRLRCRGLRVTDPQLVRLCDTYERALVTMHKMPRIWTQYLELLMQRRMVTRARRTFDRALQALPITQHDRVWQLYLVSMPWLLDWQPFLDGHVSTPLHQKCSYTPMPVAISQRARHIPA